jgi:F-type H+-transporting ATPase subunit b
MKRIILAGPVLALMLSIGSPAIAQESKTAERAGESATEHGGMEIWGWLNFALLVGGLAYIAKKNVAPYFARRSREIRKGMVEAEEARAEADAKVAEVDRRLAALDSEIEALRQEAKQEAEAEAEQARSEAAEEMAKIRMHLDEEIAAAGKSARLELRRYSAELAVGLAEKKIAARMSPDLQDRLIRSFVANLDHGAFRAHS